MIPVVFEQYGRTAPGAHASFQRLIHHRAQLLVRQGFAAYSHAKRQANTDMWAPLACLLLRAAWQSIAEGTPTHVTARPSQCTPARPEIYLARPDFLSSQPGLRGTIVFLRCPRQGWQPGWQALKLGSSLAEGWA